MSFGVGLFGADKVNGEEDRRVLPSIPSSILGDMMTLYVCTGMDVWQNPSWDTYTVTKVHLQNTNEVKKSKDNTEIVLRSVLFVDSRRSTPQLDYGALMVQSESAGKPMRCTVTDASGNNQGDFEILTVDLVPDFPATRVHHVELGLV